MLSHRIKRISAYVGIAVAAVLLAVGACWVAVDTNASGRVYDDVRQVPAMRYGLLLGTSPVTPRGTHNVNFDNRIKAAAELYHACKVRYIIASGGDYRRDAEGNAVLYGCDEPRQMQRALIAAGVDSTHIILDYEGTRTLYSVAKARRVYGLDSVLLISQEYHNRRAIWQADHYGLYAVGYSAAHSSERGNIIRNTLRETMARVKLFIDMWFGNEPQFVSTPDHK